MSRILILLLPGAGAGCSLFGLYDAPLAPEAEDAAAARDAAGGTDAAGELDAAAGRDSGADGIRQLDVSVDLESPPTFRWQGGAVNKLSVWRCVRQECNEDSTCKEEGWGAWQIGTALDGVGRIDSPVTYSEVPQGADEESWGPAVLQKLALYSVVVELWDPCEEGSTDCFNLLASGAACFTDVEWCEKPCLVELCDNGVDDDGDGTVDCDDLDCSFVPPCLR